MTELLYKGEVYAIVGAAMDVYNDLGPGLQSRQRIRSLREASRDNQT